MTNVTHITKQTKAKSTPRKSTGRRATSTKPSETAPTVNKPTVDTAAQASTVVKHASRASQPKAEQSTDKPSWVWPREKFAPTQDAPARRRGRVATAEVRNGVRKPIKGVCAYLWSRFDADPHCTVKDARLIADAEGLNKTNAQIEFYQWRKFHGMAECQLIGK